MNSIPFKDLLRDFFSRKPSDVDGVLNTSTLHYRNYLLRKLFGRFEFENVPESWDVDYMLTSLFIDGHFCITDTEVGVVPLVCGVTGINIFNHPTTMVIANPVLGSFERTISVDGALVKLQYNYGGIEDTIRRYSVLLAMCDSAIAVNLMNTKATFVFGAASKAQAETLKSMYDKISCGEPAVFMKEDGLNDDSLYIIPAKQNFVADDVQLLKRKIVNEFLTEIGINNTNLDKRERLTDDEVNANNDEVLENISHWLDNVNEGLSVANALYDLDLSFKAREFERRENGKNELAELD